MLQLSPNAEKLLTMMVGYYVNGIVFVSSDQLEYSDQAIYEAQKKSYIIVNGKQLTLTASYITNLY